MRKRLEIVIVRGNDAFSSVEDATFAERKATIKKGIDVLVLRRKLLQKIVIGDDITVTVLEICGQIARLGIEAPRDIAVHREEVAKRIEESKIISTQKEN